MKTTCLAAILVAVLFLAGSSSAQEKPVTVALVGDSTVTDEAGWGRAFAARFDDSVKVLNFSAGGRSSKSWYDEKRLPAVLQARPDFVLIQFGHNDQPGKGPERETDPATTYRDYLKIYVNAFRQAGATPILVSSVTRRHFDAEGKIQSSLAPWAAAAKEVAAEMTDPGTGNEPGRPTEARPFSARHQVPGLIGDANSKKVPFVDLHAASVDYHNRLGPEKSMAFNPKPGDLTHFNPQGAEAIADLIVRQLQQVCPDLARHLKGR